MNLNKLHNDIHEGALQLVAENRVQLFAKAKSLCDSDDEADELVIRTIDQAIRKIGTYAGRGDILSWMLSILVNLHNHDHRNPVVCGTRAVDADALERYSGADWSTDEQILRNSDSEAIRKALSGLDPKQHKLLMLRYYEELSLKEIAEILRLPIGTVSWRLHVAHRLLSGKLAVVMGKTKKPLAVLAAALTLVSAATAAVATVPALAPVRDAVVAWFEEEGSFGEHGQDARAAGDPSGTGVPPVQSEAIQEQDSTTIQNARTTQDTQNITQKENAMNAKRIAAVTGAALAGLSAVVPSWAEAAKAPDVALIELDPSVGWTKTVDYGTHVVRVLAYTNVTETYELRLPDGVDAIDCLVVGGGGGGGGAWGGGGGAGGVVFRKDLAIAPGTLTIKVGAGGAGASTGSGKGADGDDSTLVGGGLSETAKGGGHGSNYRVSGGAGGSGGGAGGTGSTLYGCLGGAGEKGQGNSGGDLARTITYQCGAGGGGAGAFGQDAGAYDDAASGNGGDGIPCAITGEEVWYAGGGAGGATTIRRFGGKGGGGDGAIDELKVGLAGTDGLGGGGGGGGMLVDGTTKGGKGGDGIVIVAYQVSGRARNSWTRTAAVSKDSWIEGEKRGAVTCPVPKLGAETMVALIAKDGGEPVAWNGIVPREVGSYVIRWSVRETDAYGGLSACVAFVVDALYEIDPSAGWMKSFCAGARSYVVYAYTNTTGTYELEFPNFVNKIDYLVVGGGGGGGGGWGGGGGAGGMIFRKGVDVVPGKLTIKVGAGGAGAEGGHKKGAAGSVSTLSGMGVSETAEGGGHGSNYRQAGGAGGSGGGAGGTGSSGTANVAGGTGVEGQGNAGGALYKASTATGFNQCGGGGGGAGARGQDAGGFSVQDTGGGGDGLPCGITGEEVWYAGGGAGGTSGYARLGGAGGGGAGGHTDCHAGQPGVNGLGGGGGGGYPSVDDDACGGAGGAGIVIIRFEKPRIPGFMLLLK